MIPYDKRSGKIWYNNELVDWQEVKLHVLSHGLHYGSCVFEGLRVYDGEIFKLEEHTDRFFYSAKRMDIKIPYSKDEINQATKKIVSVQNVQNGYIRPFAWRGSEMMAVSAQNTKIHVAIATWEWGTYFDPKLKLEGIKLNITAVYTFKQVKKIVKCLNKKTKSIISIFAGRMADKGKDPLPIFKKSISNMSTLT